MARKIFITGASSGIGAALAAHYAAEGASLGLAARRREEMERLAAALGTETSIHAVDVAESAAVRAAAQAFIARHGVPDIVIANAGISVGTHGGDADDIPVVERVMRTNVVGLAATLQPFIEPMRRRGRGTLVGIASVAGFRGLPGSSAYSASKAAAISYLESLRLELRESGVRVVTICPGFVDTPMTRVNPYRMPFILPAPEAARRIAREIDAGRSLAVVPWQMAIVGAFMRILPNWLYDRLFMRAPRKTRKLAT